MRKVRPICTFVLMSIVLTATGQSWDLYNSENSGLPAGRVNAVFIDAYGGKWFGTNHGLVHLQGEAWSTYTTLEGLASEEINDLSGEKGQEASVLFVSTSRGVSEVNYDASGAIAIDSYNALTSGLTSDTITAIVLDAGRVYYGTPVGLDIRSGESWTYLDRISTPDEEVSLQQISAMAMSPHGWNFVGTRERGVARLHYDVDGVSGASSYSTEWSGLLSDQINDIHIDEEGNQWYATAKGVASHMGYETKENWETYTELSSGLISNMVHAVAVDGNGTTWAGSDGGISRFDGFSWISYPYINGISDYSVYDVDFDLDGSIWFACDIGVIWHDEMGFPDGTGRQHIVPKIQFQLFPSIANDVVKLKIDNSSHERLSILIMNLEGRIVKRLIDQVEVFGTQTFVWNLNDPGSQGFEGAYLVVVKTDKEYVCRKMVILR